MVEIKISQIKKKLKSKTWVAKWIQIIQKIIRIIAKTNKQQNQKQKQLLNIMILLQKKTIPKRNSHNKNKPK